MHLTYGDVYVADGSNLRQIIMSMMQEIVFSYKKVHTYHLDVII